MFDGVPKEKETIGVSRCQQISIGLEGQLSYLIRMRIALSRLSTGGTFTTAIP
jgi:hypothetical protein